MENASIPGDVIRFLKLLYRLDQGSECSKEAIKSVSQDVCIRT